MTNGNVFESLFIECRFCHQNDNIEATITKNLALCLSCNRRFRIDWKEKSKTRKAICKTCSETFAKDAPPGWRCGECGYTMALSQEGRKP